MYYADHLLGTYVLFTLCLQRNSLVSNHSQVHYAAIQVLLLTCFQISEIQTFVFLKQQKIYYVGSSALYNTAYVNCKYIFMQASNGIQNYFLCRNFRLECLGKSFSKGVFGLKNRFMGRKSSSQFWIYQVNIQSQLSMRWQCSILPSLQKSNTFHYFKLLL